MCFSLAQNSRKIWESKTVKVAIIGAGLAGLSCAHRLEKLGVKPVIYEKNNFIGDSHSHASAILEISHRPISDIVKYFDKEFSIKINPLNRIDTIIHNSPNRTTTIKGNFGYFFKRGKEKDSVKNQIYSQLKKTEIIYNRYEEYEKLIKKYDYVVIATGNSNFTEELGCWYNLLQTHVRGAIVLGNFDINSFQAWVNKNYCKNGFAYLSPLNSKMASLILTVTDINEKQVDNYWELFLYIENIKYDIIEEFKYKHKTGLVFPHKIDNVYFAGNAGGGMDSFLGFGQLNAITQGVMAACSIVKGRDYEKLLKTIVRTNIDMNEFRKSLNKATNRKYDLIISSLGLPIIKHSMYYSPLNVVKYGGKVLQLINNIKK